MAILKRTAKKKTVAKAPAKKVVSKLKAEYDKGASIADLAKKHRMTEAEVTAEVVEEVKD